MAKGASPEPYRSLTLKFKETDNSFPFRRASVLQYHIPFLSFHCLVKPALIIKDCYPGSYARLGREREREGWDKGRRADGEREREGEKGGKTRVRAEKPSDEKDRRQGRGGKEEASGFRLGPSLSKFGATSSG